MVLNKITYIITKSLDVSFSEAQVAKLSQDEMRKIVLVNYISLITIFNMLAYVIAYTILDFQLFKHAIIFLSLSSLLAVGIVIINKRGKHLAAKLLISIFVTFFMTYIATVVFGKVSGFQLYLLVAAIIPIFLWSREEKRYPIIISISILVLYASIEISPQWFEPIIIIPDKYLRVFQSSNAFFAFLAAGFALAFFQYLYRKVEEKLQEQAEQIKISQEHKDMIYSVIAHDIRSPLASFTSLTELLKVRYNKYTDTERQQIIHNISSSSESLHGLLENLLDWSKVQTGRMHIMLTEINLRSIAEESLAIHNDLVAEKQLNIKLDIQSAEMAYADHHMVSAIFRNLISNAIKYTSDKGKIIISSKVINDMNQICIEDSGKGISEKAKKELFMVRKSDYPMKKTATNGSGLGLMLCCDFVENNKGEIWVESEVGIGSKFYFTLPKTS